MVKNPPANAGDTGRFLGWEDRLEKKMATQPAPVLLLGNSMDRGAWWPTVHGIAKRVGHDLAAKQQQACKKIGGKQSKQEEH